MPKKDKIVIVPAVLPRDLEELRETLVRLKGVARRVQIDVCDGKFVPNVTFPFLRSDGPKWQKIVNEEEGFPFWENFDFEADLMVKNPEESARDWIKAGASRIVLHAGGEGDFPALIKEFQGLAEIGIALPSNASVHEYTEILSQVSFVQVMGISRVGFQGEQFDERALLTIKAVSEKYPNLPIQVDGGISPDIASDLVKAGATCLISGSFILSSGDPVSAIEQLKTSAVS